MKRTREITNLRVGNLPSIQSFRYILFWLRSCAPKKKRQRHTLKHEISDNRFVCSFDVEIELTKLPNPIEMKYTHRQQQATNNRNATQPNQNTVGHTIMGYLLSIVGTTTYNRIWQNTAIRSPFRNYYSHTKQTLCWIYKERIGPKKSRKKN